MRFSSLSDWLRWQEGLHFTKVDPGLQRVGQVWQNMHGHASLPFKVMTVAGTNGKGSSVAMLTAILKAAGYRTGTYTSPHLLRYNERICIDGEPCSDQIICESFQRIDDARQSVSLTYFEFATLAAVDIFSDEQVDVAILEVGMGGRLDAVNLFDADIAIITPIALDHTQWLGDTREKIAYEKAGIMRSGHPVVVSDRNYPESINVHANAIAAPLFAEGQAYQYERADEDWQWSTAEIKLTKLPYPALAGEYQVQNAAAVIQACLLLAQQNILISEMAIRNGLLNVQLSGRFQTIPGPITRILDVTHNEQGARNLCALLQNKVHQGKLYAVLAMLSDKDVASVVKHLKTVIDKWFVAGLDGSRGMPVEDISAVIVPLVGQQQLIASETVEAAYQTAMASAQTGDTILIFGSFHTVEKVIRIISEET